VRHRVQKLKAIAEGVKAVEPFEARKAGVPRDWYSMSFKPRGERPDVADEDARMGLRCGPEGTLDAEVNLQRPAAEPATSPLP